MRKILSAVLALMLLVTLMVPCAMTANAAEAPAETSSMDANGGGFTNKLLSAEKPEAPAGEQKSSVVANVVVFAGLAVVVGVSVAMVIDKKRKLYK